MPDGSKQSSASLSNELAPMIKNRLSYLSLDEAPKKLISDALTMAQERYINHTQFTQESRSEFNFYVFAANKVQNNNELIESIKKLAIDSIQEEVSSLFKIEPPQEKELNYIKSKTDLLFDEAVTAYQKDHDEDLNQLKQNKLQDLKAQIVLRNQLLEQSYQAIEQEQQDQQAQQDQKSEYKKSVAEGFVSNTLDQILPYAANNGLNFPAPNPAIMGYLNKLSTIPDDNGYVASFDKAGNIVVKKAVSYTPDNLSVSTPDVTPQKTPIEREVYKQLWKGEPVKGQKRVFYELNTSINPTQEEQTAALRILLVSIAQSTYNDANGNIRLAGIISIDHVGQSNDPPFIQVLLEMLKENPQMKLASLPNDAMGKKILKALEEADVNADQYPPKSIASQADSTTSPTPIPLSPPGSPIQSENNSLGNKTLKPSAPPLPKSSDPFIKFYPPPVKSSAQSIILEDIQKLNEDLEKNNQKLNQINLEIDQLNASTENNPENKAKIVYNLTKAEVQQAETVLESANIKQKILEAELKLCEDELALKLKLEPESADSTVATIESIERYQKKLKDEQTAVIEIENAEKNLQAAKAKLKESNVDLTTTPPSSPDEKPNKPNEKDNDQVPAEELYTDDFGKNIVDRYADPAEGEGANPVADQAEGQLANPIPADEQPNPVEMKAEDKSSVSNFKSLDDTSKEAIAYGATYSHKAAQVVANASKEATAYGATYSDNAASFVAAPAAFFSGNSSEHDSAVSASEKPQPHTSSSSSVIFFNFDPENDGLGKKTTPPENTVNQG